jgi:hypothetical protein
MRLFLLCLPLALTSPIQAFERPPEWIHFERGPAPQKHGTYSTFFYGAEKDAKGIMRGSASLFLTKPSHPRGEQMFSCSIRGISRADIVPAMGELYRVTGVGSGRDASMSWIRLDREKWPPKVSSYAAGIAVFLRSETRESSTEFPTNSGNELRLASIEDGKEKKDERKATLHLRRFARGGIRITEAIVKVGDHLLIDGKGHEVLSIVPANEKTGVIGWVELHFAGIPEAELKRDKRAFVEFGPRKE